MQPGQNQPRDDRPVLVVLGPGPAETHRLVSTHHGHQHEVIHVWDVPRVLLDKEDRGGRHGPPNGPGEDRSSQVLGTGPQGVPKAQNACFHRYSSFLSLLPPTLGEHVEQNVSLATSPGARFLRPVRATVIRRAEVCAIVPGSAPRKHAPPPERCPPSAPTPAHTPL